MVEVVAPATLMEGYHLDTQIGDQVVQVTIPPGGVEKGQKFLVPLPQGTSSAAHDLSPSRAPVGHWKDDLFDCCRLGPCHSTVWIAYFCPAMAAGQVIHRLGLNWLAQPTESSADKAKAFEILRLVTIVHLVLYYLFGLPFVRTAYIVFSIVIIMNLRYVLLYHIVTVLLLLLLLLKLLW
jgi:hypothetical protein